MRSERDCREIVPYWTSKIMGPEHCRTNHALRYMLAQAVNCACVPEKEVMQTTGHYSVEGYFKHGNIPTAVNWSAMKNTVDALTAAYDINYSEVHAKMAVEQQQQRDQSVAPKPAYDRRPSMG
eukprot:jgi/Chrzof1/5989/UNPLg00836.t1